MVNCNNCNNSNAQYHLCNNCYNNIFKSLNCDGHCGRKCDPSQRTSSNNIIAPYLWYCETCLMKKENPNLSPDVKKFTKDAIDKLLNENKYLKNENEELKKEKDKFEKILECFKGKYHDYRFKLECFYDIIINIDSLRNLYKGWKVKFTEQGKKNYEIMKEKEVLTVGILGNRNSGKTFILSKLSGVDLPVGINTEGISIKYPRMEKDKPANYILIDSAGFENPLLETNEFTIDKIIKKEDKLRELELRVSDKMLTENFIQNFIIQKSHLLIVVIGILNHNQQKFLNRIKTENKNKNKNQIPPPLLVVHNLKTFSLKKQVEDYIQETLMKSATFKLTQQKCVRRTCGTNEEIQNQNKIYFIEEFNNEEDKYTVIYHLILAMHGTEAGNYYNDFVYEFLSEQFNSFPMHDKFPIIEDVKQQFMENSNKMIVHPIESLDEFEKSETEIKLISKDKEEEQKRLLFNRCLVDELGFSNFYGANFVPKYAYFKINIDKKPYVCIQVEIPGECKVSCRAKMSETSWNVIVKGNKMLKMIEGDDKDTSFSKREEGDFNLLVKLNFEDFQLKDKKPDKSKNTIENGLYSYYFPLVGGEDTDSDKEDD